MRKYLLPTIIGIGVIVGVVIFQQRSSVSPQSNFVPFTSQPPNESIVDKISWPLEKIKEREKLLTFGLYVTPDPENNPISPPERFTGYHTGLDIEILPGEETISVPVRTICSGDILYTGTVEGYGGVIIQSCQVNDQKVSVLYGHIYPKSFKVSVGNSVDKNTQIAELSPAYSAESGLTRKHIHLGIHKGDDHIEFKGYVLDPKDLDEFIDPLSVLENQ